jgi:SAM-dependent methyltransferase
MSEVSPANAAQAQRWNGPSGRHWIEHRERHLAEHQNLTPHLFRRAAIALGERVLDVGCGCGDTTIMAANATAGRRQDGADTRSPHRGRPGWMASAVGLDLSAPMLAVARRLAAQAGVANAGFVQGDGQACPLRRNTFDVMISNFGVMFFGDPLAAFAGLAAVMRPHGRLAFLCWQDDTQNEVFAIPLRAFGAYMQLPGPSANELFVDPRQITALLSLTGWGDVEITSVDELARLGTNVDDVMRYVRTMPMIRNLTASLDDPVLSERVLDIVATQYAACQRPDGIWVRAAAWLVTARRALPKPKSAFHRSLTDRDRYVHRFFAIVVWPERQARHCAASLLISKFRRDFIRRYSDKCHQTRSGRQRNLPGAEPASALPTNALRSPSEVT